MYVQFHFLNETAATELLTNITPTGANNGNKHGRWGRCDLSHSILPFPFPPLLLRLSLSTSALKHGDVHVGSAVCDVYFLGSFFTHFTEEASCVGGAGHVRERGRQGEGGSRGKGLQDPWAEGGADHHSVPSCKPRTLHKTRKTRTHTVCCTGPSGHLQTGFC